MENSVIDDRHRQAVNLVAVGASAGGVVALQEMLKALPHDLSCAIVLLLHLPPLGDNHFASLVAKWTSRPVLAACDGAVPATRCIYVPSPGHILTIEQGVFHTRPADDIPRRPGIDGIDIFLESLAADIRPRSIAVILSGTGMDGTAGAVRLREADGVVIVQDPLTCQYDGMPNAVIERGVHDHILPAAAIGRQLVACSATDYCRPETSQEWADNVSQTLPYILDLIHRQAGFDLSGYKPSPLMWRIQQRMAVRNVMSFGDYAALLEDNPVELEALVRGISIHVTEFFRDESAWASLKREVLMPLATEMIDRYPLRLWSPACSTGEEAYSVAMLMDEVLRELNLKQSYQVFATDIVPEVLARAGRGFFTEQALTPVSAARRRRYFYAVDDSFRIRRFLRERMIFAPQDLIFDTPFARLDLITCRNLLIYLEPETIKAVIQHLHSALRMGGYLFLGKSEGYLLDATAFETVCSRFNIYRKVGPMSGTPSLLSKALPVADPTARLAMLQRAVLEQFEMPSVLVNRRFDVLRVYGDTSQVLGLSVGEPTYNLLDLVPRQWQGRLKVALRQALEQHKSVILDGLIDRVTGTECITVRLMPMQMAIGTERDRLLVTFIGGPSGALTDSRHASTGPSSNVTYDASYPTAAEFEALQEELQALNEELKASNIQLNASNADLNEVNEQLQDKIAQLQMQSRVLSCGAVMTLFLDRDMMLRWFTPTMREIWPVTDTDIGRRITDLRPRCQDPTFREDVQAVLDTAQLRNAMVRSERDRWFMRRIYPSVSDDARIEGVAITFTDISERVLAEEALRASEHALRRKQAWLSAQNEAFQAAMNGASLNVSLGLLIRSVLDQAHDDRRCAFYIAKGQSLNHIVGMSDEYARCVDGFLISPESLACGLAVATGEPVITRDIFDEPRWQPWTWMAVRFGYRGCWTFPVETFEGNLVGSLAMYFAEPREPAPFDLEQAEAFTRTAAIIIWRHWQSRHEVAGGFLE